MQHTEPGESDEGGQGFSGDDGENDYDDHHESTRNGGKRKRPISVSYVHILPQAFVTCDICHFLHRPSFLCFAG